MCLLFSIFTSFKPTSTQKRRPVVPTDGVLRNVIDFGAFVDIGVKQDGLVHISKLSDRFVKHPSEVVAVGDIVQVWITSVDTQKGRIGLSMLASDGHE